MLDDQHGNVARKLVDDIKNDRALGRRNTGRRLVEQQHLRLQPERDGDLHQALLAVGQLLHRQQSIVGDAQTLEQRVGIVQCTAARTDRPQHVATGAGALADCETDILQNCETLEERVDLERPAEAAADAGRLRQRGDVLAAEQNPSRRWCKPTRDQVDERRLAGAVRSDQRMARAGFETEMDLVGHDECTEPLVQTDRLQRCRHRGLRTNRIAWSNRPSTPPRANRTSTTSSSPIQKFQNTGSSLAS